MGRSRQLIPTSPPGEPAASTPPGTLRVALLDGFELEADGRSVEVPASAQRVVALLCLHERPLLRTFVATVCWPTLSEARARASLRSTLWRLRTRGATPVAASPDHLWIEEGVEVDYREAIGLMEQPLQRDPRNRGMGFLLHNGTLLPDWLDEWVLAERERFMQLRLHFLEVISARLVEEGNFAAAVDAALAAVSAEPLRESAHRALIAAFIAEGNIVLARRQYEACRRLLADELQERPSPMLIDLIGDFAGDRR